VSVTARQEALVERMGGQIDARARLDAQAVTASASASASTDSTMQEPAYSGTGSKQILWDLRPGWRRSTVGYYPSVVPSTSGVCFRGRKNVTMPECVASMCASASRKASAGYS